MGGGGLLARRSVATPRLRACSQDTFFPRTLSNPQYISGAIMFEETLYQSTAAGKPFVDVLKDAGIVPGIKVDTGLQPLPGTDGETSTQVRGRAEGGASAGVRRGGAPTHPPPVHPPQTTQRSFSAGPGRPGRPVRGLLQAGRPVRQVAGGAQRRRRAAVVDGGAGERARPGPLRPDRPAGGAGAHRGAGGDPGPR